MAGRFDSGSVPGVTVFVLLHGAGDSGWAWHRLEAELAGRGHTTVAPDLPGDQGGASDFGQYAEAVVEALGPLPDDADFVVVGHSLAGFTAPIVAEMLGARELVLLAAMIPAVGETPSDWWSNTGYVEAAATQAARDGGLTGNDDSMISFYNGVPEELAREAERRAAPDRVPPMNACWPLSSWPAVPTRFLLCQEDRFFPAPFLRALVPARLGIAPEEVPGGHCMMLSHPRQLAEALECPRAPTRSS